LPGTEVPGVRTTLLEPRSRREGRMETEGTDPFPEVALYADGYTHVVGVDEVGMGCLAGPVVAGAVVFRPNDWPVGIRDSKQLTEKRRESVAEAIRERALRWAVAHATVEEIDTLNILRAAQLAMRRAIEALGLEPEMILVDGRHALPLPFPQRPLVKGDQLSVSIGAASILAKVHRDRWMCEFDAQYPGYGLAKHKGYGSPAHRRSLVELGPSPIHRKSFRWKPV
jgi:ribonuclease HII